MSSLGVTFVGTATTILELAGLRLLTDPVFDPPGATYEAVKGPLGALTKYTRLAGPALNAAQVGPIDAVLLSHDHHGDNLDPAGRQLLPSAKVVLTTVAGARRLARRGASNAVGLVAGQVHRLGELEIVAAPARHGPPGTQWITGPVIGFFLRWPGGTAYVSGDTLWHRALADFARTHVPQVALIHVGAGRFRASLGLRYSASAKDVVAVARAWPAAILAPIHYEGWSHFSQGRAELAQRLARYGLAPRLRWLTPGCRESLLA
ncbi:MAG: MBL fold metallo-hydrolase [Myxococcales bacterium]|nr:MBL fold metallo-hydrolase [Myxococcales bacterium]